MAETSKNKIYYNDNENSVADVLTDMEKMAESTDEAIEKSKYNDAAIKKSISDVEKKQVEKNTEQDSKIVELQTEKAKLETELKEIQEDFYQNSIRGQASGEYIHVEDSSNCRSIIGIGGNHEQETREGYNLLNFDVKQDSKVTYNKEDGTVTINGQGGFYLNLDRINLTANKTYKQKLEFISGSAKTISGTDMKNQAVMSLKTETWLKNDNYIAYTPEADTTKSGLWLNANVNFDNAKIRIWAYEGTEDKGYEQYGAMPSSYYPSQVVAVGSNGSVKVTKCNKNIMPIKIGDEWQYTTNGIKNLKQNSGSEITKFNVSKGQNIKIGFQLFSRPSQDTTFAIYFNDLVQGDINLSHINNSFYFDLKKIYERNYIPNKDGTISIKLWGNENADIFEFQLWAELDNLTDYEEHREQSYIMPVQQEMLEGDYFDFENEEEVHIWDKLVLTGDENWQYDSNYKYFKCPSYTFDKIPAGSKKDLGNQKSNYFEITSDWGVGFRDNIDKNLIFGVSDAGYKICIRNTNCTTVEEFKAWLKEKYNEGNPVLIYYSLATPVELDFTDEQKEVAKELNNARTYKNVTNITTDSKAILSLDYAKDLETLLNNTQALAVNNASEGV